MELYARDCEERSDETIQDPLEAPELLRFARNDGVVAGDFSFRFSEYML
jgi:hypothetical protein